MGFLDKILGKKENTAVPAVGNSTGSPRYERIHAWVESRVGTLTKDMPPEDVKAKLDDLFKKEIEKDPVYFAGLEKYIKNEKYLEQIK